MKLLEPVDINGMVIPNRVVVPAMVTRLSGAVGLAPEDRVALGRRHRAHRRAVRRRRGASAGGGLRYTYHVRAFDKGGRASPPSNSLRVEIAMPDYAGPATREVVAGRA